MSPSLVLVLTCAGVWFSLLNRNREANEFQMSFSHIWK